MSTGYGSISGEYCRTDKRLLCFITVIIRKGDDFRNKVIIVVEGCYSYVGVSLSYMAES